MAERPDEWISFEAAGRLIDGPDGWVYDHSSNSRPRAEAFMKFASDGTLRTNALNWTVCKDGKTQIEPTDEDRTEFLTMLFARIKNRKDRMSFQYSASQKMDNIFKVADDLNGHYEAARLELHFDRPRGLAHQHSVTALRFHRGDMESLFSLAGDGAPKVSADQPKKGGRPAAADWEGAALEMARRFYVGDLKPDSIATVQKQMTDWLAAKNVHPSPTAVREHAKRCFDAFSTWNED